MKLKNVNIIELHVEKAIVALSVILSLMIVWSYVLGDPYAATVAQETGVRPDQVKEKIINQVRLLEQKISPGARSPLPDMTVPAYTAMFRERLSRVPISVAHLDPLGDLGLAREIAPLDQTDLGLFSTPPTPPAPTRIAAAAGFGVLLPDRELADYFTGRLDQITTSGQQVAQAYVQLVPQVEPRDFRYVSVAGIYDIRAWQRKLLEGGRAIPDQWRRSSTAFTGVVLERQTLDQATGQWRSQQIVSPLPEAVTFSDVHDSWSASEAKDAIQLIQESQDLIAHPPFVPMTDAAIDWSQPQEIAIKGPFDALISGDASQTRVEDKPRTKPDPNGKSDDGQSDEAQAGRRKVWAHDLTVESGQTYRYRLSVKLINPLFQRSQLSGRQREEYFHKLALQSLPSPWSDPIQVDPEHRFFVVGGSSVENEVTVEVWRVFNGRPRVKEFRVKPGDPIGGVVTIAAGDIEMDVDMGIGITVVDLLEVPSTQGIGTTTTKVLFFDVDQNSLIERTIEVDRDSPERAWLLKQASLASAVAEANGQTTFAGQ